MRDVAAGRLAAVNAGSLSGPKNGRPWFIAAMLSVNMPKMAPRTAVAPAGQVPNAGIFARSAHDTAFGGPNWPPWLSR